MALSFSTDMQTALNQASRYGALMYTFVFGTGTYGIWTAQGERLINGVTYRAGGSAIDIQVFNQNSDGSVSSCVLGLSTQPDKGLTADILQTFYDEDWYNKVVTIDLALFDPATRAIIQQVTFLRGVTQSAPYTDNNSGKARIDLTIASRSIELGATGGAYRNSQSQIRIDPDDTSLVNIGTLNADIVKSLSWGQG